MAGAVIGGPLAVYGEPGSLSGLIIGTTDEYFRLYFDGDHARPKFLWCEVTKSLYFRLLVKTGYAATGYIIDGHRANRGHVVERA